MRGVLLGQEQAAYERQQLTNLIRVGGRLAVLGVEDGIRAMGWWHVARPGTWSPPQGLSGQPGQEGADLTYAKSLCDRVVVTNGYCADWRPPKGQLCPACAERI